MNKLEQRKKMKTLAVMKVAAANAAGAAKIANLYGTPAGFLMSMVLSAEGKARATLVGRLDSKLFRPDVPKIDPRRQRRALRKVRIVNINYGGNAKLVSKMTTDLLGAWNTVKEK